jgi:integrase
MNLKQIQWSSEDYGGLFKNVPSQLLQNPLLQKDTWLSKEDLGLEIHEHHKVLTLNFSRINQSWLKVLVQLFILTRANVITSPDTLQHEVGHLNRLSKFLDEKYISSPKYIDSQLFEEFDNWIRSNKKKLSERTISLHYTTFNNFFTTCRLEQWLEVNTYWFKGRTSKHTKVKNDEINYIPEEIWNQLEEHLQHFPEAMQRKVLIIRTLGLRIGELLNLPFDCLRKKGKIVATHKPQDAIEEYMRLRMHQITTQQGECHRSNLKKPCPTVNGCWRCGDWMTSEKDLPCLKQDLKRLKDELQKANKLGMVRVAKEIQKDINYLQIRINALEEIVNND